MKIKKGDKVKMLSGKDKGKTGKVLQVLMAEKRASVEGLNLLIKHLRPRREGEKGQRVEFPALVDMSKLILICPKCQKETRVEYKIVKSDKGNKKYRQCKKCQETIA
ncbi:MAG: 50S ribosomal protein L24 [Parcubacteria group bacterium]